MLGTRRALGALKLKGVWRFQLVRVRHTESPAWVQVLWFSAFWIKPLGTRFTITGSQSGFSAGSGSLGRQLSELGGWPPGPLLSFGCPLGELQTAEEVGCAAIGQQRQGNEGKYSPHFA